MDVDLRQMGVLNIWVIAHGEFQLIALQLLHFAMTFEVAPLCQSGVWKKASGDASKLTTADHMAAFYNSTAYCPIPGFITGGMPGGGVAGLGTTSGGFVSNISYVRFTNGLLNVYGARNGASYGWWYIYNSAHTATYSLGEYPAAAVYDGMKGWQIVGLTITPTGVLIDEYNTNDCCGGTVRYKGTTCYWYN